MARTVPDLNGIEDVWNIMEYKLKGQVYEAEEDLWTELTRLWNEITQEGIQNLYSSFPRRIEALNKPKG